MTWKSLTWMWNGWSSGDGLRSVHSSTVPRRGVIPIAWGSNCLPLTSAVNAVPVPNENVNVRLRATGSPAIGRDGGVGREPARQPQPRASLAPHRHGGEPLPGNSSKPSSYGRERKP